MLHLVMLYLNTDFRWTRLTFDTTVNIHRSITMPYAYKPYNISYIVMILGILHFMLHGHFNSFHGNRQ